MKKVQFTETVLRDANQSLMATRLPYADYEAILSEMDKAGYYSVECWGGATFDSCLRYLNEDPWERLRNIRKNMPNTKLQMLLRGQNLLGYKHYHDDVVEKFVELSIKNGIDILRIFDALNDFRNLGTALDATKKYATANTIASGCISYTQSPVHTVDKYVEMCKELKNMGFHEVVLSNFQFPNSDKYIYDKDKTEALQNAMRNLLTSTASDKGTFTLSFGTNDPSLTLPEGARSRIYLQGIDAKDVDTAVEKTTVPDRSAQIVFLATTNDTRFDKYSVLRPLSAAKTLEAAKAANAATEEAEQ